MDEHRGGVVSFLNYCDGGYNYTMLRYDTTGKKRASTVQLLSSIWTTLHQARGEERKEHTPTRRQRTTQRRSNHPPRRRKEGNTKITTAALLRNSKGWRRTILHPPVTGVLLRRGHGVSTEKPMQFLESLYTSSGTFIVPKWQHICAVVGTTSIDTTSMQELRGTTSWCIGFCLVT